MHVATADAHLWGAGPAGRWQHHPPVPDAGANRRRPVSPGRDGAQPPVSGDPPVHLWPAHACVQQRHDRTPEPAWQRQQRGPACWPCTGASTGGYYRRPLLIYCLAEPDLGWVSSTAAWMLTSQASVPCVLHTFCSCAVDTVHPVRLSATVLPGGAGVYLCRTKGKRGSQEPFSERRSLQSVLHPCCAGMRLMCGTSWHQPCDTDGALLCMPHSHMACGCLSCLRCLFTHAHESQVCGASGSACCLLHRWPSERSLSSCLYWWWSCSAAASADAA